MIIGYRQDADDNTVEYDDFNEKKLGRTQMTIGYSVWIVAGVRKADKGEVYNVLFR